MFDVERVKQNENVISTIIYASTDLKFLRIEKEKKLHEVSFSPTRDWLRVLSAP